ncbi:MAG: single-stranded DNA-binding protein [Saprospiraceae bacterium]|nr:single-stranded DNA-binding protein [Saprospiraceae bacterium]MCB9342634.1 single-stranded DNA-binding protein [Lewinellaceae bacterium]
MAINNTVTLIGNTGDDARIVAAGETRFASLSLATTDSYKDKDDTWQNKETVWHKLIAFSPKMIETLKSFKKGTRLKITGSLSYRDFEVQGEDGGAITKREASIIVRDAEQAPLVKKDAA